MNNIEERLTEHLHERANAVDLWLTPDDIRRHADRHLQTEAPRSREGRRVLVAAAGLVAVVGAFAVFARGDASTQLEMLASTGEAENGTATTTSEERAVPEVLSILAVDDVPLRVAATGTVFAADQVGIVEAGPPSDLLVAQEPWLTGATCVASKLAIGCAAADGQVPPGSPDDSAGFTYGASDSDGYHVVQADEQKGIVLLVDQGVGVFVTGLPDTIVEVEAHIDDQVYVESPVQGTVGFPISTSAKVVHLVAVDEVGVPQWDSLRFELPQVQDSDLVVGGERAGLGPLAEETARLWAIETALLWALDLEMARLAEELDGSKDKQPAVFFRKTRTDVEDHVLLISARIGDPQAVEVGTSDRGQPLQIEGSAQVFLGTNGDQARAVELFDGDRIVYVRSEGTEEPLDVETLVGIAIVINQTMARAG